MNRQDAIKELTRAGRKADVKAILTEHAEKAQSTYSRVLDDPRMADTYKRQALAQQQVRVQREVDAALADAAAKVVTIDRDDAASVFGVKGLTGDPATLIASRRDAGDRVANITDEDELQNLLRRANRTGDEVMARAVAERATELQAVKVVNAFIADRPNLDAAVNRLWNSEQAETGPGFDVVMLLSELRAESLQGMRTDQVEQIAEGADLEAADRQPMFDSASASAAPKTGSVFTGPEDYATSEVA